MPREELLKLIALLIERSMNFIHWRWDLLTDSEKAIIPDHETLEQVKNLVRQLALTKDDVSSQTL